MTSDDHDHDPEPTDLGPLADHLRALRPARLDPARRDAILAAADRASASRRPRAPRVWPALAASFALIALVEGILLARRPAPRVVERVVVVREPAQVPPQAPVSASIAPVRPEATAARPASDPVPLDPVPLSPPGGRRSRFDLAERSDARPDDAVVPRLPALSGADFRREILRQALASPGGPS